MTEEQGKPFIEELWRLCREFQWKARTGVTRIKLDIHFNREFRCVDLHIVFGIEDAKKPLELTVYSLPGTTRPAHAHGMFDHAVQSVIDAVKQATPPVE